MTSKRLFFVDTTIFVYARDLGAADKHTKAKQWLEFLWASKRGRISVQVLSEFLVTCTKKLQKSVTSDEIYDDLRDLATWGPAAITVQTLTQGLGIYRQHKFSWWDCLILASSIETKCAYLLSEDMQENQVVQNTRIINPFTVTPEKLEG